MANTSRYTLEKFVSKVRPLSNNSKNNIWVESILNFLYINGLISYTAVKRLNNNKKVLTKTY